MSACLYDVSVWIALAFSSHPHHGCATAEFQDADSFSPAAFCRATQRSFLRLITTPAVQVAFGSPTITNDAAWVQCEKLLALPQVTWLSEPPGFAETWSAFARLPSASPKVWMDAYLAAFARQSHIPLATLDRDFVNFRGVAVRLLQPS